MTAKILCPIDFSETSELALKYAIDLAKKIKSELAIVHVVQTPVFTLEDTPHREWLESQRSDARAELEKVAAGVLSTDLMETQWSLRDGVPHLEIGHAATDLGATLIVMGTHGRSGLPRMFMGSVAERVLRTSKIPVLLVPRRSEPTAPN